MIRRVHLTIGVAGVLVFLGTGVYMRTGYDVEGLSDGPRLLLRSRHIYLLLASLVNLALGAYFRPDEAHTLRRRSQVLGSLLLWAAPPMLVAGFFRDAVGGNMQAPIVPLAIVATLTGTLLHAMASIGRARRA